MKAQYKEKLLLHRVQHDQDAEAYGSLYDTYVTRIYRFIMLKVSNKEIAEDLTSDVFLKTWHYLVNEGKGRDEKIRSFSGLIYRIARTTLIDYYRTNKAKHEVPLEHIEDMGSGSDILADVSLVQDSEQVMHMIRTMKREYQEIILLRYIEELSMHEIAEILQKSPTAVRVTLHRAMKILKKMGGHLNSE